MPRTPNQLFNASSLRRSALFVSLAVGVSHASAAPPAPPTPVTPYTKPEQVRPNLPASPLEEIQPESQGAGGVGVLPPLVREGSFISSARGQMAKGKSGRWFFIFDRDASGRILPPMVLMPSINLAAMERMAEHSPPGTRMLVTGQVTVYHDLNYFLPTAPPLAVRATTPPAPATPAPDAATDKPGNKPNTTTPATPQAAPRGSEPSVDDIVRRLDKAISTNNGGVAAAPVKTTPTAAGDQSQLSPPPTTQAASNNGALLSAGVLSSRRGRITRAKDGSLSFRMDSGTADIGGPKGPAITPEPLILQPSQTLAAIEALSERSGEGATYTVSGEVTTYHDRNYLLIRSYKVNRVTDQVMPTQ